MARADISWGRSGSGSLLKGHRVWDISGIPGTYFLVKGHRVRGFIGYLSWTPPQSTGTRLVLQKLGASGRWRAADKGYDLGGLGLRV